MKARLEAEQPEKNTCHTNFLTELEIRFETTTEIEWDPKGHNLLLTSLYITNFPIYVMYACWIQRRRRFVACQIMKE